MSKKNDWRVAHGQCIACSRLVALKRNLTHLFLFIFTVRPNSPNFTNCTTETSLTELLQLTADIILRHVWSRNKIELNIKVNLMLYAINPFPNKITYLSTKKKKR
jgi:hypothetical protein